MEIPSGCLKRNDSLVNEGNYGRSKEQSICHDPSPWGSIPAGAYIRARSMTSRLVPGKQAFWLRFGEPCYLL